jgi:hypothetical protein
MSGRWSLKRMEPQPIRIEVRRKEPRAPDHVVPRGWRIVRYERAAASHGIVLTASERTRWAVEHRGKRVVWGLQSLDAAQRWLARVTAPTQLRLVSPTPSMLQAPASLRSRVRRSRPLSDPPYWAA